MSEIAQFYIQEETVIQSLYYIHESMVHSSFSLYGNRNEEIVIDCIIQKKQYECYLFAVVSGIVTTTL